MYLHEDYSYIRGEEKALMEKGYGSLSVHSLHFSRYYTEEQKQANLKCAESMTQEEWTRRCDEIGAALGVSLMDVLKAFVDKYDIHQISEETSTLSHYRSDWDLYFWSNKGWNGKEYMDCFSLTFNDDRSPEQNLQLLEELISLIDSLEYENISCRIQYDVVLEDEKIEEVGKRICAGLEGKFFTYHGMNGKIKLVQHREYSEYGFFQKNAKRKYYPVSMKTVVVECA